MKTRNLNFMHLLFLALSLTSCFNKDEQNLISTTTPTSSSKMEAMNVPSTFNFSTTAETKFDIGTFDNTDKPIKGVVVSVYSYPEEKLLVKGITSQTGTILINQSIPSYVKKVAVRPDFIGLPSEFIIDVANNVVKATFGGKNQTTPSKVREAEDEDDSRNLRGPAETQGKYPPIVTLGKWSSTGVPTYLEATRDVISAEFLANIDASVPERQPVTVANPDYLNLTNKNVLTK